jgi:hypothetical protein
VVVAKPFEDPLRGMPLLPVEPGKPLGFLDANIRCGDCVSLPQPGGGNYESARFNALRHAVLSQYTVLPWEKEDEYAAILDALVAEHSPQGPTEEHLVEELAGVFWRKRRLRLAEASLYRSSLKKITEPHRSTVRAALVCVNLIVPLGSVADALEGKDGEAAEELGHLRECEDLVRKALDIINAGGKDA